MFRVPRTLNMAVLYIIWDTIHLYCINIRINLGCRSSDFSPIWGNDTRLLDQILAKAFGRHYKRFTLLVI